MSSGCDNVVQLHDVKTKETMEIGSHEAPIKCCKFLDEGNWMLVTAGWDKKLKVNHTLRVIVANEYLVLK